MKIRRKRIESLLGKFDGVRILVVGDLMLDRFVWGKVTRISPEAPVPVVDVTSESDMPGGSANVVKNLCALGVRSYVCGVIGDDDIGESLREKLADDRIDLGGLIVDAGRMTTLKTRIIAHIQQVVRVDKESRDEIAQKDISRAVSYAESIMDDIDAVIIEDYGKGMVTQRLVSSLIRLASPRGIILCADPKMGHELNYRGITAITPNRAEAFWMAWRTPSSGRSLEAAGKKLLRNLLCKGVLVTLGERGMCLFQKGKEPASIPTAAREVFDVSGAGDTVISTFTAALAAGADMREAAVVANYAAGVVVGKVGTGTASREEILEGAAG